MSIKSNKMNTLHTNDVTYGKFNYNKQPSFQLISGGLFNLIRSFGNLWTHKDGTELVHMEFYMKRNPDGTIEYLDNFDTDEIKEKFSYNDFFSYPQLNIMETQKKTSNDYIERIIEEHKSKNTK